MEFIRSNQRGIGNHGWLQARYSFSFNRYYEPTRMGFSALRVINEDRIAPGAGFAPHSHQDMEIITYIIDGAIEHRDSNGNRAVLSAGEFQVMSAGAGIEHSEFNASKEKPLHLLQIWITPNQLGGPSGYQQKSFGEHTGLTLIASPDGRGNSYRIKQQADLSQLILEPKQRWQLSAGSKRYLHQVQGTLTVNGESLASGDGVMIDGEPLSLVNTGSNNSMTLVFELP